MQRRTRLGLTVAALAVFVVLLWQQSFFTFPTDQQTSDGPPSREPSSPSQPSTDHWSTVSPRPTARFSTTDEQQDEQSVAFRDDLKWSERELRAKAAHDEAFKNGGHAAVLTLLADTDTPILPWKRTATPIVCNGMEYFSGHFSIPAENIVKQVPTKTQDWATVIPGKKSTYVFKREQDYRADLERSRMGVTRRRYGFATNRNLEMLAAGCMPYFCGIDHVPKTGTLDSLPKYFFQAWVGAPGLRVICNPPKKAVTFPVGASFNETRYRILAEKLLAFTTQFQTTTHFAKYVLSATSLTTLPKNVLLLWASHYTIMLTGFLHGLRELGVRVEDVPRRPEVYRGPGCEEAKAQTYAKGWFFFCKATESEGLSRTNISARILAREFDLIIISTTDTLTRFMKDPYQEVPYFHEIVSTYPRDRVLTMNDADLLRPMQTDLSHRMMHNMSLFFKRETHGCDESIW